MSASEKIGGLFGSLIIIGASIWGAKKIGEALDSEKKETKSILKDTEPFT